MTRIIKLQPEYRQGKFDRNMKKVPKLTLKGNWLAKAGFHPSKLVRVTVDEGRLTIISID